MSCGKYLDNLRKACRTIVTKSVQKTVGKIQQSKIVCTNTLQITFNPHVFQELFHTEKYAFQSIKTDFSAFSPGPTITTTKLNKSES